MLPTAITRQAELSQGATGNMVATRPVCMGCPQPLLPNVNTQAALHQPTFPVRYNSHTKMTLLHSKAVNA
jgi:hypothetical protein